MLAVPRHAWRIALVMALAASSPSLAGPAGAAGVDREDALQIFNRDVYFIDGSTLRHPTADTSPDEPLYSDAGVALSATWGEWQEATASSLALEMGPRGATRTDVRLEMGGLIPNGVYSAFYLTLGPDSEHAGCPGVERSLPLTSLHGDRQSPDPSSFVASADGSARYHGRVDGSLLQADTLIVSLIYHANSQTYHPFPNAGEFLTQGEGCRSSFGHDAMRQLLVLQKLGQG